jgi:hypothetical protein
MTLAQAEEILGRPGVMEQGDEELQTYVWRYTENTYIMLAVKDNHIIDKLENGLNNN